MGREKIEHSAKQEELCQMILDNAKGLLTTLSLDEAEISGIFDETGVEGEFKITVGIKLEKVEVSE